MESLHPLAQGAGVLVPHVGTNRLRTAAVFLGGRVKSIHYVARHFAGYQRILHFNVVFIDEWILSVRRVIGHLFDREARFLQHLHEQLFVVEQDAAVEPIIDQRLQWVAAPVTATLGFLQVVVIAAIP